MSHPAYKPPLRFVLRLRLQKGGRICGTLRYILCVCVCVCVVFLLQEWTKLERPMGAPWPVERASHAAICINYGEEHPQLLVTGGVDNNATTLQDAWILDVKSGKWREVNGD